MNEMSEFGWDAFAHGKLAVHCPTKIDANVFLNECYKREFNWGFPPRQVSGSKQWKVEKEKTFFCYEDGELRFGNIDTDRWQIPNNHIHTWHSPNPIILTRKEAKQALRKYFNGRDIRIRK